MPLVPSLLVIACTALAARAGEPLPVTVTADAPGLSVAREASDAVAALAARVSPATVFIEADKREDVATGLAELLEHYQLPRPGRRGSSMDSSGSGVIIDAAGIVLTNHHVIAGANHAVVTLHDERRFIAEVVGSDPRTDVAVLRIVRDPAAGDEPFPWAELGDSRAVRVGQQVIAVGHPYGFQFTVTTGIVSARGRRNLFRSEIQDYLQTDAVLSAGSSGGPLFDLDGRVIGINTAVFTPAGGPGHVGIGFAIPADLAGRVARELITNGRVARAGLGLSTRDRPSTPAEPRPGAEITRITPQSPAAKAALVPGDVVIAVDAEPVSGSEDLRALVLARGVGADLVLSVQRGGDTVDVPLRTGDEEALAHPDVALPPATSTWAGLTLGIADDDALVLMGVDAPSPRRWPGLLVYAVDPDSPADVAGIRPGDLLLDLGDTPIRTPDDLPQKGKKTVTVRFWRTDGEVWAVIAGL